MIKKIGINSYQLFQLLRYTGLLATSILLPHLDYDLYSISVYETFLYITGLFTFFWVGGMMNQYLKFSEKQDLENHTTNYFFILVFLSILTISIISFIQFISPIHKVNFIMINILLSTPFFIIEHFLLLKKSNQLLIGYGILTFFTPILAVFISHDIDDLITNIIILNSVKIIFGLVLFYKNNIRFATFFNIKVKNINLILLSSFPFIGAILASGSADYIDGFLVKHFFTNQDFSIYRYGAKELPLVLILANSLGASMIPLIHQNLSQGILSLKESAGRLLHISFPIALLLMIFSQPLFSYFFTENFNGAVIVFQTYLLLIIPRLVFPQTILQSLDGGKWIFISAITELALNVVFSILLLHLFGLMGIALGTVIRSEERRVGKEC